MTVTYLGNAQELDPTHKARFIKARGQVIGVELRHAAKNGSECKGSPVIVQWEPYGEARPLFTLTSGEGKPISVEPHISCTKCSDRGYIRDAKWVSLEPAPEGFHDAGPLAPVVVESKLYGLGSGSDTKSQERVLGDLQVQDDEPPVLDFPTDETVREFRVALSQLDWSPRKEGGFTLKDSGERQNFDTGAVRDSQTDKARFDLIPVDALGRLADLYAKGAIKYDENNWRKGIPYSRVYASMFRHMMQWAAGDTDEDHLAAVAWNAFALMHYESAFERDGRYEGLDDMERLR